jgi:hypothetical protein
MVLGFGLSSITELLLLTSHPSAALTESARPSAFRRNFPQASPTIPPDLPDNIHPGIVHGCAIAG